MSRTGVIYTLAFMILIAIGHLIFPLIDEPDYIAQVGRMSWHNFYSIFVNSIDIYYVIEQCQIISERGGFFSKISIGCFEGNVTYFFERMRFTLFATLPLILILLFKTQVYYLFNLKSVIDLVEWDKRVTVISLCMIFPGMTTSLGYLSPEVVFYMLSLMIFLFFGRYLVLIPILYTLFILDEGNVMVVSVFMVTYITFYIAYKYVNKRFLIIVFLTTLFLTYMYGNDFLFWLADNLESTKVKTIMYSTPELFDKYPKLLRPIITIISGIFMTASGIKSPFVYPLVLFSLYIIFFKNSSLKNAINEKINRPLSLRRIVPIVGALSAIATISGVVFSLPTHAWAKYYLFLLPFLLFSINTKVQEKSLFIFFILLHLIIFINVAIYYFPIFTDTNLDGINWGRDFVSPKIGVTSSKIGVSISAP